MIFAALLVASATACYKIGHNKLKQDEAKIMCVKLGGTMVSIESRKQEETISQLIKPGKYWLGRIEKQAR